MSQALVLQLSTSAQPFAVEAPLVTPLASLTPLTIDGVEYLLLQDVLEVLEMREEELYSNLISDIDESFINLDVQEQPPAINKVARYDDTSVSTLDAIVAIQESIAQAAPEYDIPFDEFEAFKLNCLVLDLRDNLLFSPTKNKHLSLDVTSRPRH